jgi:long-chain acyl-CoA synthetase
MTIRELLENTVRARANSVALRFKAGTMWKTISYAELLQEVRVAAEVIARLGVRKGDRVALFCENRPWWVEVYLGIVGLGATAVPIDAGLQEQEVAHILADSGAHVVLAGSRQYSVLADMERKAPHLRHIVILDGKGVLPTSNGRSVRYYDYGSLRAECAEAANGPHAAYNRTGPADEDLASLIYTSGTTGRQKGAMLTHRNFTANVESCVRAIEIYPTDHFLLVLPLHHAFAFTADLLIPLRCGCEISFVESLKTVGENLREVSPTVLIGVPLLLEKMYNRIWNGLKANKFGYALFLMGVRKPIIRKLADKLGGRLRLVVTGGAPCDPGVIHGFGNLGIRVIEGYGLTETAPVLTLNPLEHSKPGTVGKPLPEIEIKIVDPGPDGSGEIAARGPNVMKGYHNNPAATAEVFRDGWLLTGDIGYFDEEGYLVISGRKKSVIVNREGKNIYPEEVEQQIVRSPFIREALVLAYREADMKVGELVGVIVVPDQEALDAHIKRQHRKWTDEETEEFIRGEVKKQVATIAEYKRPRRILIRWEDFEKTTTGKIKRYLYTL